MKLDSLKFPTGKRLTSWLCTSAAAELNLAQLVVRAGLELGNHSIATSLAWGHFIPPHKNLSNALTFGSLCNGKIQWKNGTKCYLYSDWLYILPRVANEHKDTPTRPPLSFPFPSFEVTNLCWFKKKGSFYPKILYQVSLSLCTLLLRFFSDLKSNLCSNKLSEMSAKPSNSSHVDCRNQNKKSAFISVRRIPLHFFTLTPKRRRREAIFFR